MNKIAFGQYYHKDSLIHRIDPRTKIISLILLMAFIFIIPRNNFYLLGIMVCVLVIVVILTKVPLNSYLRGLKHILYLLLFSFFFQAFFNQKGDLLFSIEQNLSFINLALALTLIFVYLALKKYLKFKFLWIILLICGIIYCLQYPIMKFVIASYRLSIYQEGLFTGFFIIIRIMLLIIFSSILTLTTKPTDLNNALEWLLKPFSYLGIQTSTLSMMISISMRFIPTLFFETDKILKAQASRGVDFKEGKLKEKINQIISLLIPMFIISFKRAIDLADAMETRGYIPGAKRTKLAILKFRFIDYSIIFGTIAMVVGIILFRVL